MIYLKHIWTVLKHKWYVGKELMRYGLVWRALTHDLSKLFPPEIKGYSYWFYHKYGKDFKNTIRGEPTGEKSTPWHKRLWDRAWKHHQEHNKHHWQYWIITKEEADKQLSWFHRVLYVVIDNNKIYEMPKKYVIEMVCDWIGAGIAYNGKRDILEWYDKNKDNMTLHPKTRGLVESLIEKESVR